MPLLDMQITLVNWPMCFTEVSVRVTRNRETQLGRTVIQRELRNLAAVRCVMCGAERYVTVKTQRNLRERVLGKGVERNGNAERAKRLPH
jgi:hypothetical protein